MGIIFRICQFRDRIESKFCGEFFCHQYLKPKVFQSSYQMNNLGGIEHTEIRVFSQDFTFNAEGIGERKAQDRTDADNTLIRRIDCGLTDKSYSDLDTWIFYQKINRFVMLSYNISTNNCWHFSLALLQFLDPDNLYDGQDHLKSNIESAQIGRRVAHQVLGRDGAQL